MHTRRIRLMPVHLYDLKTVSIGESSLPEDFSEFQLVYVLSGNGYINDNLGNQFRTEPGDLLFIPPDIKYSYNQTGNEKLTFTSVSFSGTSITEGLPYALGLSKVITVLKEEQMGKACAEAIRDLFRLAASEYAERSYADDLILHTILYRMLDLIYTVLNQTSSVSEADTLSNIPDVLSYIRDNLSSDLSIKNIVEKTGHSAFYIYDAFAKEYGMTPWEYITNERLKKIKTQLSDHPEMSVYEAGLSAGMTSKSQIYRSFKKYCGISPGKYRELSGPSANTDEKPLSSQLPIYLSYAQETIIKTEENWDATRKGNTWQLMLCLDGSGIVIDRNENEYFMRPGFICLLTPESECRYTPINESGEEWRVISLQFSGKYAKELINILRLSSAIVIPSEFEINIEHRFSASIEYSFIENFDRLYTYSYKTDNSSILHGSVVLYELLTYAGIVSDAVNDATGDEKKLLPVIDIINMHYNRKLTLDELAEAIGVNVQSLIRMFKNVYNTTPAEYITSIRILRAKRQLLRFPGKYISEIAEQTGFSGSSYFISTFKRYEGITPEEYRNLYM